MDEPLEYREHPNRDHRRRSLETPSREDRSRSRSGLSIRRTSRPRDDHSKVTTVHGIQKVRMLKQELRRECKRLRASLDRHQLSSRHQEAERRAEPRAEQRENVEEYKRSHSPSFSKNDLASVLKLLREDLSSQPHHRNAQFSQKIDHHNMLPNFDPSTKNQRVDIWLKKVNECASVYGWDDRTTTHFAMQKLQGLAKIWYEGLNSILFSWDEWQGKLINAFSCEQNYGQTLEDMLKRKSKFNEPIEVYYYEKLALLNQCEILGKRAVDCIIHGLSDRTLRSGALALRCTHPDQLLQFLISNKDTHQPSMDCGHFRNRMLDNTQHNNNQNPKSIARSGQLINCFNCKEKGHSYLYCPKPLLRCHRCNRLGHMRETCPRKPGGKPMNSGTIVSKTMRIDSNKRGTENPNSKFIKEIIVNGVSLLGFIDFGSEVSLIKESITKELGLIHNNMPSHIKGFGNSVVETFGELPLDLSIDNVNGSVICKVVKDELLEKPLLVGQTYTELPHIVTYKDVSELKFFDNGNKLPFSDIGIESGNSLKVRGSRNCEILGTCFNQSQR